ncbi:hypothetical protein [Rhizobium leguminosarum]|uniref:hypothetical protein n=1 Tax=Rhizobium leguminosarum TaxID=384 RepID=UPI001C92B051|nr:hypothetical protein [Rhizobium leguminosarum]MBY2986666.1 hypothetical protein [Rhizobium leguminosarum]
MISADEYLRALSEWHIPESVVATKVQTNVGTWQYGELRSLEHQCWQIATADPDLKISGVDNVVSFDAPVGFPGLNLAAMWADNLGKKRFVLRALTTGYLETSGLDALVVAQAARSFDWVLRFRNSKGYLRNQDFGRDDFDEFRELLRTGEILDLLPVEEYLERFEEQGLSIFSYVPDGHLNWDALAGIMGVTPASISRSSKFAGLMLETFPALFETYPGLTVTLRRGVRAEAPTQSAVLERNERSPSERRNSRSYFDVWDYLSIRGKRGDAADGLSFDPYKFISKKQMTVENDPGPPGRTPTVLPADMFRLLNAAANWISNSGDYIIDAYLIVQNEPRAYHRRKLTRELALRKQPGAPDLIFGMTAGRTPKKLIQNKITVTIAVGFLLSAIAMVILFFGARRLVEGSSLKVGCLIEEKPGLLELEVYIAKTRKGLGRIPVPEIVRVVVKMLERLSEGTRRATGRDWLFNVAMNVNAPNHMISKRFDIGIRKFVDYLQIEPPHGADVWDLGSHVFRRGFGIWFIHGLEGASMDPLSLLYDHWDPRMTKIYFTLALPGMINRIRDEISIKQRSARATRTPELQAWLDDAYKDLRHLNDIQSGYEDARCGAFVSKMFSVWMRKEIPIGKGGRRLYNDVKAIAQRAALHIRVGSRANNPEAEHEPILEAFDAFAKTHFLEAVIGTNVYCTADPNDPSNKDVANCLTLKSRLAAPWREDTELLPSGAPDYVFAADKVCVDCEFCAIFKKGRAAISRSLREEEHELAKLASAQLLNESQRRWEDFKKRYAAQLTDARAKA